MADDNPQRPYRADSPYRSLDPQRRESAQAAGADHARPGDPLAELARLIGQNDPFAEFGRNDPRTPESHQPQPAAPAPGTPEWRGAPLPSAFDLLHRQSPAAPVAHAKPASGYDDPFEAPAPAPIHTPPAAPARPASSYDDDLYETPAPASHAQPVTMAEPIPALYPNDGNRDERIFAAERSQQQPRQPIAPGYANTRQNQPRQDQYEADQYGRDDGQPTPPEEEFYDDAPRLHRRHGGLVTAVALIGCAMLGTAGAYGYRTYYSHTGSTQAPPVITADKTPSKIVPAETSTNKLIQDRVDPLMGGERIVSREEEPVPLREPAIAPSPRVILPTPVMPNQSASANPSAGTPPTVGATPSPQNSAPAQARPASAPTANASGEPRRVRTVTIRADGTEVESRPSASAAVPQPAQSAPAARPATRSAAGSPRPSGAPLSLDPQARTTDNAAPPTPAPAPARTRVATAPPSTPQLAAAPSAGTNASGGYLVQISSQRSEADARSAFRSLQSKFPNELGSRSIVVRRADLGDKGVYYRAMVGPFGSSDEAAKFCSQLKASGGQCLIQRN